MQINARLVVITRDKAFFSRLNIGLIKAGANYVCSCTDTLLQAESKFAQNKQTVVLVDTDTCPYNGTLMRQWREKYAAVIALTGTGRSAPGLFAVSEVKIYFQKPATASPTFISSFTGAITQAAGTGSPKNTGAQLKEMAKAINENNKMIAIASSTGGTEALEKILRSLGADIPPIVIVQHMPSGFTKLFADRLNNICKMSVTEAKDNDYLRSGVVYIAPAGLQMKMMKSCSKLILSTYAGPKVNGVIPAADVLFDSIAPIMKSNAVGVILTGMGADGAKGLYKMHASGAKTIGQNKETCVVYGMPKAAYDLGALDLQLPIQDIAGAMMRFAGK